MYGYFGFIAIYFNLTICLFFFFNILPIWEDLLYDMFVSKSQIL